MRRVLNYKIHHHSSQLLNIRVLDLSRVLAGPYCSMILADMGAEVIKLEVPDIGDDSREFPPFINTESLYYANLNRGKHSITLNLKQSEGTALFKDLIQSCDVLLENFRPGTMDRLGLGYGVLKNINPGLIYASISGFGQSGPYRDRPGYDIIGQAMGGLLGITGWPDSPPTRTGTAIADILSALFCCIGILAALTIREQTNRGQHIDVSLVDSVVASLENIPQKFFVEQRVPERIGNRYEFIYPYDSFQAADGWVIIAIANDSIWNRFAQLVNSDNLAEDERFSTNAKRVTNHRRLKPLIESWTSQRLVEDIVRSLNVEGIPASPIYTIKDVVEDPHIQTRQMFVEKEQPRIGTIKVLGCPIKMSETHPHPKGPSPALGEDTEKVLQNLLRLDHEKIEELKRNKVI